MSLTGFDPGQTFEKLAIWSTRGFERSQFILNRIPINPRVNESPMTSTVGPQNPIIGTSFKRMTRPVANSCIARRHNIKRNVMRKSIILAGLAVAAFASFADAADDHHATVQPEALKWTAPAAYGSGAQFTVIKGDPTKEGMYVVRLKVPKGFRIQAHTHPNDENVTVLSGTFHIGTGDKFDENKGETIKAGGYSYVAKGMTHYAFFPEETVIQLHGIGPQGITYVNPADDPRKK